MISRLLVGSVLSLAVFAPATYAQIKIGPRIAITSANETSDPSSLSGDASNGSAGFSVGLELAGGLSRDAEFSTGLMFERKGPTGYALDYLELPLELRITLGGQNMHPYFFVGPTVGLLVGAAFDPSSDAISGCGGSSGAGTSQDISSDYKSAEVTMRGGAGFKFDLNNGKAIFFDVDYALGLFNVIRPSLGGISFSRVLRISAAYLFPLGHDAEPHHAQ